MTRLFVSIVFAVLGSLFLIGWGLDKLVSEQVSYEENPDIIVYKKLIEGFSLQLSATPPSQLKEAVEKLSNHYQATIELEDISNIALPETLFAQLDHSGGLLLATNDETYLLKKIPNLESKLLRLLIPDAQEENQSLNIFLTAILYIGVCIILMLWLLPLARRLFILTKSAASIGKGEVNVRVPVNKYSYIKPLEISFNLMASQIEKLMADNKLLARSLSHDIRTPMSCLRFGVEAALDCNDIEKKNTYLTRIEAELTNMEEMTSAFLSYAGMERQGIKLALEPVKIEQFIADSYQDFIPFAEQYNITLEYIPPSQSIQCLLDCHWFYRVIQNLISNAVQYAEKKVVIGIKLMENNTVEITIEDDGKGIDKNKLDMIFDPFVKLDDERSREQGHFGLGLAICQKVVDWHKGRITANNSNHLLGACFTISLPLDLH